MAMFKAAQFDTQMIIYHPPDEPALYRSDGSQIEPSRYLPIMRTYQDHNFFRLGIANPGVQQQYLSIAVRFYGSDT